MLAEDGPPPNLPASVIIQNVPPPPMDAPGTIAAPAPGGRSVPEHPRRRRLAVRQRPAPPRPFAGVYLPADIFARYHRLRGNDVLMVSGSDAHGTPITVRADRRASPPRSLRPLPRRVPRLLGELGISFDLFTTTGTRTTAVVTWECSGGCATTGYIYQASRPAVLRPEGRALPARPLRGGHLPVLRLRATRAATSATTAARTLDPDELIGPRCRLTGATPACRDTEHFFL